MKLITMIDKALARARVIERWRLRCRTARSRPGAGNFKPGVTLLVGEKVSQGDKTVHPTITKYHAPFCSVLASSGWLNTLLAHSTVKEASLFWINALHNDGSPIDLTELVQALQPKHIVALGMVAKEALDKQNILHQHVPHPQYWKRFKSQFPYPLISLLEQYELDSNS